MSSDCNSCPKEMTPIIPPMGKPCNAGCETSPKILSIDNPAEVIIFHKATIAASLGDDTDIPPENGLYRNVLLEYEANGHVYLYSSDGIPTLLNNGLTSFNDLTDRPLYGGVTMTGSTNIPDVTGDISGLQEDLADEILLRDGQYTELSTAIGDEEDARIAADALLADDIDIEEAARIAADNGKVDKVAGKGLSSNDYTAGDANTVANLNRAFVTGGAVSSDTSTVTVTNSKYNPTTSNVTTEALSMPVASMSNAGVMNVAMYSQIDTMSNNITAILNGAVSVSGLSASPSQSDLTTAWETETGITGVINGAKINDPDNQKVWTYYTNTSTWYAATNTAQVTISQWTNAAQGTVLGSINDGQIYAENDGTGSVNGWDTLKGRVTTLESNAVTISMTNTDPGEGSPLSANEFIAVY